MLYTIIIYNIYTILTDNDQSTKQNLGLAQVYQVKLKHKNTLIP